MCSLSLIFVRKIPVLFLYFLYLKILSANSFHIFLKTLHCSLKFSPLYQQNPCHLQTLSVHLFLHNVTDHLDHYIHSLLLYTQDFFLIVLNPLALLKYMTDFFLFALCFFCYSFCFYSCLNNLL